MNSYQKTINFVTQHLYHQSPQKALETCLMMSKKQETATAELYIIMGNLFQKLKDNENAQKAYFTAAKINPIAMQYIPTAWKLLGGEGEIKLDEALLNCHQLDTLKLNLVHTVTKSGTWYNKHFFHFYSQLVAGKEKISYGLAHYNGGIFLNSQTHLNWVFVGNTLFDSFKAVNDAYKDRWEALKQQADNAQLSKPHVQKKIAFMQTNKSLFDPQLNPQVKIACFYRNPLDHAVSTFNQYMTTPGQKSMLQYQDDNGNITSIETVKQLLHTPQKGIENYITEYLPFKVLSDMYPENVVMVAYENLHRHPHETFTKVLKHFQHDVEYLGYTQQFNTALQLSSQNSLKNIEKQTGVSIAGVKGHSHIQDGSIGRWKQFLDEQDVKKVANKLEEYGLSLDNFQIE